MNFERAKIYNKINPNMRIPDTTQGYLVSMQQLYLPDRGLHAHMRIQFPMQTKNNISKY